jgi:hypothetical protein
LRPAARTGSARAANYKRCLGLALLLTFFGSELAAGKDTGLGWYACTVRAASHTGRYTFRIGVSPCRVYWREIGSVLKIRACDPPVIAALKPSATSPEGIVWFNLKTGAFYDYLSGVKDRGACQKLGNEPQD